MVDILKPKGGISAAPGMQGVIGFDDIFAGIVELAVAEKEANAPEDLLLVLVARDSIGDERQAGAIDFAVPSFAAGAQAEQGGCVDFGIGEGFVAAFIPAPAGEDAEPVVQRLLDVGSEAVLDGGLQGVGGNFGNGSEAGLKSVNSLAIAAHVGVIDVSEQAEDAFLLWDHGAVNLKFNIFGACARDVGIEMDAVGDLGHESFGETRGPVPIVVFHHGAKRKAPGVRGIVVSDTVVDGPVHELKICVAPVAVYIEEIDNAQFPESNLDAALWQFAKERKRSSLRGFLLAAQRNNLMRHQPGHVRRPA